MELQSNYNTLNNQNNYDLSTNLATECQNNIEINKIITDTSNIVEPNHSIKNDSKRKSNLLIRIVDSKQNEFSSSEKDEEGIFILTFSKISSY